MAEHDMRQADRSPPAGSGREGAPERDDAPRRAPDDEGAPRDEAGRLPGVLAPIEPAAFGYEQARHLLLRAGFGGTPEQIRTLANWGPERAVDHLLNVEEVEYKRPTAEEFDKNIMRPPSEAEQAEYRAAARRGDEDTLARFRLQQQQSERADRDQVRQMQRWWLTRLIETPKPLEEKMTLFWHGLFATNYRTIENSYHMFQQNQLFRKHSLGSYAELLRGIIRDPAMLAYLNNNQSKKDKPNENLAREIMELFSLGVGNYTERDIKEGARALTGYTFEDDGFVFEKKNHDTGVKTILSNTGPLDGDGFVKAILAQSACPKYITRRLYSYFVSDVPPDERGGDKEMPSAQRKVLQQLAYAFGESRYQLKPLLRKLFLSEHFYEARFMNDQIKSPVMLAVGAVRSLNAPVRDLTIVSDALDLMGQNIFYPPSVKGWDGGRSWINTSTLFVRQNTLAFFLSGKKPQGYDSSADTQKYDVTKLLDNADGESLIAKGDVPGVADAMLRLTLGWTPKAGRDALLEFVKSNGGRLDERVLMGMLLVVTAMPEYQLC